MNLTIYKEFKEHLRDDIMYNNMIKEKNSIFIFWLILAIILYNLLSSKQIVIYNIIVLILFIVLTILTMLRVCDYQDKIDAYLASSYPNEYSNMKKIDRYNELLEKENDGKFKDIEEFEELKSMKDNL